MHVENEIREGALRMPMFYSGPRLAAERDPARADYWTGDSGRALRGRSSYPLVVQVCIADRASSSGVISALITLVEPLAIVASHALDQYLAGARYRRLVYIVLIPTVFVLPFYFVSRFVLITEAFLTLRNLPPAALQSIAWTTVIPHFQT